MQAKITVSHRKNSREHLAGENTGTKQEVQRDWRKVAL
jgi:hypothetical protein